MRGKLQGSPIKKNGVTVGWRVRVTVTTATGGKTTKGFDRKTLAAAQDAAVKYLGKHGRFEPDAAPGTVKQVVALIVADLWSQLAEHTKENYLICAKKLADEFGNRPINTVSTPQITNYLKRYSDGSKRMMNEHFKVAKAVFGYAASDLGWIDRNPVLEARKPKATGDGKEWPVLVREEFDRILPHMDAEHRLFYRLVGETGARPSEAWGLDTNDRLEFLRDVWWLVVRRGKTEAATRRVPIPDSLARDLQAAGPKPFATIASMKDPNRHLRNHWADAMNAAKIPFTRPYEVRAMRINEWRRMAVPGLIRKSMVGHTSERTTNEWYDHVDAAEVLKALGVGTMPSGEDSEP